jgi:aspartyl-tRNA(Asn)/glutamyl-tRNA(Gln) amidotransferase subunit B
LTSEKALANYFEDIVSRSKSPAKTISSWIAGEFMRYMNDLNIDVRKSLSLRRILHNSIDMVTDKTVSASSAKVVLAEMFKNGGKPAEIVKRKILPKFLMKALFRTLSRNIERQPKEVGQYLRWQRPSLQWLMGQVARATKGKADPNVTKELLVKALEKKK